MYVYDAHADSAKNVRSAKVCNHALLSLNFLDLMIGSF